VIWKLTRGSGTPFSVADALRWIETLDEGSILEGDIYDKANRTDGSMWFWEASSSRWKQKAGQKYGESLGDSSTSSNVYQQKLRLSTSSLIAGDYRIGWSIEIEATDDKGDPFFQIDVDDTTQIHETDLTNASAKDVTAGFSGFDIVTLAAGVHTIDLDFRDNSKKTLIVGNARLEINPK